MPRFVVLLHETPPGYARPTHYDLMLEQSGVLWTWALESLPQAGGGAIPAERLADHRLDYLQYEGEVAGNRGRVVRVDQGLYSQLPAQANALSFNLQGTVLRGVLVLTPQAGDGGQWQVQFDTHDPPAFNLQSSP